MSRASSEHWDTEWYNGYIDDRESSDENQSEKENIDEYWKELLYMCKIIQTMKMVSEKLVNFLTSI